MKRIQSG
ncbi:hypothetical protein E2C01_096532 [Portunus trituberculatus]|nr:hypothetical protein [Portunus trituberculatus]